MIVLSVLLLLVFNSYSQKLKNYTLASPNGKITVNIAAGDNLTWSVKHGADPVILPSAINMQLQNGEILGKNIKIVSATKQSLNQIIHPIAYKKKTISDICNQLIITIKGDYGIVIRAYDDGAAYRFFTKKKGEIIILSELSEYNFSSDDTAYLPHVSDLRGSERYTCSFEEFYNEAPLSKMNKDTLGYLPLLVKLNGNKKAVLLDADVQDYPATLIQLNPQVNNSLRSTYAPYPLEEALGGFNRINYMATKRADYIAKTSGTRNFPWRVIVISSEDKELLNNDMVQKLSEPSKIKNADWIKPGKVAWDWWNDWNLSHVDFKAGINNPTYKYYIDFASANRIEYIVLDEGWSDNWDLNKLKPQIELVELIQYGKQKNVGVILWSTWYALSRDIEGLCKKYSEMGVKGFKVDFFDRNDQKMIASCYEMAAIAAKYHILLDYHGIFAPQGLQRTWPNVINFEGVRGMEWSKWSADQKVPAHEVSIPFIRMLAGPMDYTPGAMRNATRGNARPSGSLPVSQGTRCHQMAMYIVYEGPLQMLADNPTVYMKEQECTDFISAIPTVFDETVALDGKLGEYAVLARKKNNVWYIGALSNWNAREIPIDLSFLGEGNFEATIFKDGINAGKDGTDYKKEVRSISANDKLIIAMQSGGGWGAIIKTK